MSANLRKTKANFNKWDALMQTFNDISWEEASELLKKFDIRIPRLVMPNISYPLKLYRVRAFSAGTIEDISNPKTFSYPPQERATTFQRANIPRYPVFYGAFDGKTALEELRLHGNETVKRGDTVFLSEWTIKEGTTYSLAHLTLPEIANDQHLYGDLSRKVYSEIKRIFNEESTSFAEEQSFLYQEASKIFLSDSYIESGILAHEILYKTPEVQGLKIDGLLYPSCSNNFRSINCALHPDFVDKSLKLELVRKLSFEEFTDIGAQTNGNYFGEFEQGRIIWKSYYSELFVKHFTTEVELSDEWTEDDVRASKLYINGIEKDIQEYCHAQVDTIDLSRKDFFKPKEAEFRTNEDFVFIFEQRFDKGVGYLKNNDRVNQVSVIRWKIPLKTSTKQVSTHQVYSDR